jgi:hypothetical protein
MEDIEDHFAMSLSACGCLNGSQSKFEIYNAFEETEHLG